MRRLGEQRECLACHEPCVMRCFTYFGIAKCHRSAIRSKREVNQSKFSRGIMEERKEGPMLKALDIFWFMGNDVSKILVQYGSLWRKLYVR